jgi:hypothetical protein
MSSPRDLRLERLGEPGGRRLPYLSEVVLVGPAMAGTSRTSESRLSYEALIDAVFTAPGAQEWLWGLRRLVTAMLGDMDTTRRVPASCTAIRTSPTAVRL